MATRSVYSLKKVITFHLPSFSLFQNDSDKTDNFGELCEICLSHETNLSLVEENNNKYHYPCINLYLNCVEPTLPQPTAVQ
jgi:hypothetical protein